jgi:hypothetical protein
MVPDGAVEEQLRTLFCHYASQARSWLVVKRPVPLILDLNGDVKAQQDVLRKAVDALSEVAGITDETFAKEMLREDDFVFLVDCGATPKVGKIGALEGFRSAHSNNGFIAVAGSVDDFPENWQRWTRRRLRPALPKPES